MKQRLTPTVGPCDQEVVDSATLHSWQGWCSIAAVSTSLKHMLLMKQVPLWSVVSAGVAPQVSMHLKRGHTHASAGSGQEGCWNWEYTGVALGGAPRRLAGGACVQLDRHELLTHLALSKWERLDWAI